MVEKGPSSGAQVAERRPYETMVEQLRGRAQLDGGSSFDIASQVIDKIAEAETFEDMIDAQEQGPGDLREMLGVPLTIQPDVRIYRSADKYTQNGESLGVYIVFDAVTDTGETLMLSTGAVNVVSSLYRAQIQGWLPQRIKFVGKETANGTLIKLGKA